MTLRRFIAFISLSSLIVLVKTANLMIPMKDFEPEKVKEFRILD